MYFISPFSRLVSMSFKTMRSLIVCITLYFLDYETLFLCGKSLSFHCIEVPAKWISEVYVIQSYELICHKPLFNSDFTILISFLFFFVHIFTKDHYNINFTIATE